MSKYLWIFMNELFVNYSCKYKFTIVSFTADLSKFGELYLQHSIIFFFLRFVQLLIIIHRGKTLCFECNNSDTFECIPIVTHWPIMTIHNAFWKNRFKITTGTQYFISSYYISLETMVNVLQDQSHCDHWDALLCIIALLVVGCELPSIDCRNGWMLRVMDEDQVCHTHQTNITFTEQCKSLPILSI